MIIMVHDQANIHTRVILSGTKWSRTRSATRSVGIYGRMMLPLVDPQNAGSVLPFKNQQIIADF